MFELELIYKIHNLQTSWKCFMTIAQLIAISNKLVHVA